MNTRKFHYYSGLLITIFVGVHLFNHFMSLFGAEVHLGLMHKLRVVYRNPLIETLLLGSVFIQIISGLCLFVSTRKSALGFFRKLQIWSGLYLAIFLLIHVGAVLAGRYLLHLDTNLYFGVAGLNTFPFNLFFVPYYGLAIIAFFSHLAAIHNQKMHSSILGLSVNQQSKCFLIVGFVLTVLILFGLTNGLTGFNIPEKYNILIGK